MNVVLIYPNQTELDDLLRKHPHAGVEYRVNPHISLGMLSLVSNIIGHRVTYLDNNIAKFSNGDLIKWLSKESPDVVGFGGTFTEWPQARRVSQVLRNQGVVTVYGGSNATVRPEKHIKHFDYVARGLAEKSFQQLLDELDKGNKEIGIPGICFKAGNLSSIEAPVYELNLDELNPPDRSFVDITKYRRDLSPMPLPEPVDIVMSTRGCPFDCKFCSSKTIWNRRHNKRSVDLVIEEIKGMMEQYGTRSIHFREDNFVIDKKRLIDMCFGLKHLDIKWICQMRIDSVDETMLRMMKDSGCVGVTCGFKSANDSTLEYIRKGFRTKDIREAIDTFGRVGLYWLGGFMVGVLNEGEKEIIRTLTYAREIGKKPYSLQQLGAMRFVGIPVSETYREMISSNLVEYDWQDGELLVSGTHKLTAKEVDSLMIKCS